MKVKKKCVLNILAMTRAVDLQFSLLSIAFPKNCEMYHISRGEKICMYRVKNNYKLDMLPTWVQFSSVAQLCPTLGHPMNHSTPGLPVHHQLPESTQTHVHRVSDAIQPSHPLSSPSPLAPNPSQHQSLFKWVSSLHQVAKVLEFQLQDQFFQWTPGTDFL